MENVGTYSGTGGKRVDAIGWSGTGLIGCHGRDRHHLPLIGAVVSSEGSFPLITLGNVNQMVHMPKINFSIDLCLTWGVKEVRNEG